MASALGESQVELVRAYLSKARDKARVARDLLARREWDDAVSRAYYAAFHAARAVLLTEGQRGGNAPRADYPIWTAPREDGEVQ